MEIWKVVLIAIVGLVFIIGIVYFLLSALGYDGVITKIVRDWIGSAG